MAKDVASVGSGKAEIKKMMKLAKDKPIHMAFATGADGKVVLQMHKMKPPRSLEKDLKESLEGGKNHRFGTVMVDAENPKLAKFVVNKAAGGIARKLVIALKGTGFKKIQIVTEDGEALEEAEGDDEEEEDDEDEGHTTRPRLTAGDDEEATSRREPAEDEVEPSIDAMPSRDDVPLNMLNPDEYPDQPGLRRDEPEAEPEDADSLHADLTDLVKQMIGVIKRDPTAKTVLAELATDAQASLKRGDLDQAAASIEILREAIDSFSEESSTEEEPEEEEELETAGGAGKGGSGEAGKDGGKGGGPTVQTFHKSRVAWTATRAKVDAELQKLSKAIMEASEGEDMVEGFEEQFFQVVDPVLSELDETLSETLAAAADADEEERAELLADARKTIARYTKFVESSSIISDLDNNPFVPLAIGKTLTSTLSTLSSIMR